MNGYHFVEITSAYMWQILFLFLVNMFNDYVLFPTYGKPMILVINTL